MNYDQRSRKMVNLMMGAFDKAGDNDDENIYTSTYLVTLVSR